MRQTSSNAAPYRLEGVTPTAGRLAGDVVSAPPPSSKPAEIERASS